MASLRALLDLAAAHFDATPDQVAAFEREIRLRHGGERVYVAPPNSRKDPARAERIAELARTLPTGIVAQRAGVSSSYVRRVIRRPR